MTLLAMTAIWKGQGYSDFTTSKTSLRIPSGISCGNGRLWGVDRQPFDENPILGKVDVDVFVDVADDFHDQRLHLLISPFAAIDVLLLAMRCWAR